MTADPGFILVWIVRGAAVLLFGVLWLLVARGDWKEQKIAHRYLRIGLIGALVGYAALGVNTGLGFWGKVHWFHYLEFYRAIGSHLFLCGFAAMALWVFRVWPAGDAKLFMFLALLYPLTSLFGSFPEDRLFLTTLINIFIPSAAAVFLRATYYIFDTRLRGGRDFLVQLGWQREVKFFLGRAKEQALASWKELKVHLSGLRGRPWLETVSWTWTQTKALVPMLFRWFLGMASMSIVSYFFKDFFKSPVLLSLLCMAMFFLWGYVARALGLWVSRVLLASVVAGVVYRHPQMDWGAVFAIFRNITVFSFFMFLGMNWAMQLISGGWGGVGAFLVPFLFPIAWFVLMRLEGVVAGALWWGFFQLRGLIYMLPHMGGGGGGGQGGPYGYTIPYIPWREHFSRYGDAIASVRPVLDIVMAMAWMGMFFGLSLVLVRKWDEEVRPSQRRQDLAPRLLLAPAFLDRLREDEDFFEEHFTSVYADGITVEQVTALKIWCEENEVDTIPLAPTMSFAFWIFLGFFLSLITGGGHVLQLFL